MRPRQWDWKNKTVTQANRSDRFQRPDRFSIGLNATRPKGAGGLTNTSETLQVCTVRGYKISFLVTLFSMFERLLQRLSLPRIVEFLLGVILATVLVARYQTGPGNGRALLEFLIPWKPLWLAATIFLFLLAARLIAGRPKNYSNFFLQLFVKMFGTPKKKIWTG